MSPAKLRLSRFYCLDRDPDRERSTLFIAGMGRSGTTWLTEVLNCRHQYRDIFEPFHPHRNRSARCFNYHHYMARASDIQRASARRILAGQTHGVWTGKHNVRLVARQRIVKDIRANLMLHWLKSLRPNMPLVLLMRNPIDVYRSWCRLGWGMADQGQQSDFSAIVEQRVLLDDFPLIAQVADEIDKADPEQVFGFLWCVLYYVPLQKLAQQDYMLCQFEHLRRSPVEEFGKLCRYLAVDLSAGEIERAAVRLSATSVSLQQAPAEAEQLYAASEQRWRKKMSPLLRQFELDRYYQLATYGTSEGGA